MIKQQNRHMSMSVYLATLAVTDSISLASGTERLTTEKRNCESKSQILPFPKTGVRVMLTHVPTFIFQFTLDWYM